MNQRPDYSVITTQAAPGPFCRALEIRVLVLKSKLHLIVVVLMTCLACGPARATEDTVFDAWTVRCERVSTTARSCIMLQDLILKAGGQTVLQFSLGVEPVSGTPTVLLTLPLGISLPPGVSISIDSGTPAVFPVERCDPDGCQAGMRLRETTIAQLGTGEELEIRFSDGERQPIVVPVSLQGFAAAFAALSESQRSSAGAQ